MQIPVDPSINTEKWTGMEITYEWLTSGECILLVLATQPSSEEQILCLWDAIIDKYFKEGNDHCCMLRENRKEEGKLVVSTTKCHINFKLQNFWCRFVPSKFTNRYSL